MKPEHGNVLFLILIAVALFAALSYAVTSSSRTGEKGATGEAVSAQASAILSYASAATSATQRLILSNNCTVERISFENPIVTGYSNSNSPSSGNRECWLFDPAGGNLSWLNVDKAWQDPAWSADTFSKLVFPSQGSVKGIGLSGIGSTAGSDLFMVIPYLTKELCLELAKRTDTDINGQIPVSVVQGYLRNSKYRGIPGWNSEIANFGGGTSLLARHEGCFQTHPSSDNNFYPAPNTYHFYRVLMVR